jgi:predicted nucleic acid-binding Zn ribbon protein
MDLSGGKKIQVNVMDSPNVECEKCENIFFEKVTIIKKISKLLTGSPEDQLVPMETYVCAKCGHMNKEFDIVGDE